MMQRLCLTVGLVWAAAAWAQPERDEILANYRRLQARWEAIARVEIDGRFASAWLEDALDQLDRPRPDVSEVDLERTRRAAAELASGIVPIVSELEAAPNRPAAALTDPLAIHTMTVDPYVPRIRALVRLAVFAGVVAADAGREDEAVARYVLAIRLGADLDRDPLLIGPVAATNVAASVGPHLARLLARGGSAAGCRSVIEIIRYRVEQRASNADLVAAERRMTHNTIELMGRDLGIGVGAVGVAGEGLEGARELVQYMTEDAFICAARAAAFAHSDLIQDAYARAIAADSVQEIRAVTDAFDYARDTLVADIKREVHGWRDEILAARGALPPARVDAIKARLVEILGATIAISWTSPYLHVYSHIRSGRVWLDLLGLAARLRLHHVEHGAFPEVLDAGAIAPSGAGGLRDHESGLAYQYRREGTGYRLWAVGTDGRDHRGWEAPPAYDHGDHVIVGMGR